MKKQTKLSINRHNDINSKEFIQLVLSAACNWIQNNCWDTCSDLRYVYIVIQQRNNMWRNIPSCPLTDTMILISRELFSWYCQPHVTGFKTIAELLVQTWCMYT